MGILDHSSYDFLRDEYGLSRHNKETYYGKISDYYIIVQMIQHRYSIEYRIKIGASKVDQQIKEVSFMLNSLENEKSIKNLQVFENFIQIDGNMGFKVKRLKEIIDVIMSHLLNELKSLNIASGCFATGIINTDIQFTSVNHDYWFLSQEGLEKVEAEFEDNRKMKLSKPENMLLGIIGALVGAVIGGVLWFIVGQLGYIVFLVGILAIWLAFKGYQIGSGGRLSKSAALIVMIVTVAVLFFANTATFAYMYYEETTVYFSNVTFWEVFLRILPIIHSDPEASRIFWFDTLLGVGLTVVIGGIFMRQLYIENSGEYKIERHPKDK